MDCIEITDFKTNEIICQKCGLVLQDNVSQDNKINNEFSNTGTHVNNSSILRFQDMGLATIIDKL